MGDRKTRGLWAGGMGPGEALPWGAVAGFECATGFGRESSDQAPKLLFSFWFCYIFSHPWVQKSCLSSSPSLSHSQVLPGSSLLCRDCQPWKWERQWSCQLWGADSCVTQPAEKVTTPMEMMCLSHREKRMAHHRPFMRMQGMDRGRRSPSCTAQGGLEGGEIGQGLFACQDSCEEAGVSMKNKIGPPALLTKDEEAPSASCSKS